MKRRQFEPSFFTRSRLRYLIQVYAEKGTHREHYALECKRFLNALKDTVDDDFYIVYGNGADAAVSTQSKFAIFTSDNAVHFLDCVVSHAVNSSTVLQLN